MRTGSVDEKNYIYWFSGVSPESTGEETVSEE
jgi:hypothetical protein